MFRSAIADGDGNTNNNFRNSETNEDDEANTDIELPSSITKPKDPEDYENSDDVNLMKRKTDDGVNESHDVTDYDKPVKIEKRTVYGAKKAAAQGLMDIALITSNANQLRNLMVYQRDETFVFYSVMSLIILSLVLQITVGIFLIFKGRFANKWKNNAAAARVNNQIMAAVFLITIINIFIAAFSMPQNIPTTQNSTRTSS